jgi:hypothetical protein
MKYNFLNYFFLFSALVFTGCKSIIIEKDNINNFVINEIYGSESDYIKISGLIMYSAYVYKNIDIIKEGDTAKILLYATVTKLSKNSGGSFNISISVEEEINKIIFGNNNIIIWERKPTDILQKREKLLKLQKYTKYDDIINEFGEPDAVIGSGFLIIQYTLNNNRKVILNFAGGRNGLMSLIEVSGNNNRNEIFNLLK